MSDSPSEKKKKPTSKTSLTEKKVTKKASRTKQEDKGASRASTSAATSQTDVPPSVVAKSSKTKLSPETHDEPLDLSLKKQRTQSEQLYKSPFYEFRPTPGRIRASETNFVKGGPLVIPYFRVPLSERPWGSLYFYENKRLVLSHDLWNYEPIKISGHTILGLAEVHDKEKNVVKNYNDWLHVIGKN